MSDEAFINSEFRSSNRKRLLKGLFYEMTMADKTNVVYTLKDEDHLGYPSLFRLYMEANDPTEWKFATTYLESFDHWELLCNCTWFKPYLERWRKSLELKMKSEALANIVQESRDKQSKGRLAASRFILEKGWEPKDGTGTRRGRPSKESIKEEAIRIVEQRESVNEDYERLKEMFQ